MRTKTTKVIHIQPRRNGDSWISEAIDILRKGGLVAFPTETVYGLGADALNPAAVKLVYDVKGRPPLNPMIVHIASIEAAEIFAQEIPEKGRQLAKMYWPGPLTLVVGGRKNIPSIVTGGLQTVAIRIPDHPVALKLLNEFGGGLVGPSANLSGRPSPTAAEHVLHDLNGKIDLILDAGPTQIGVESTVIDVTIEPPVILRKGGLAENEIVRIIGPLNRFVTQELEKRSPGTRYRHYAPHAKVILVHEGNIDELTLLQKQCAQAGRRVASITHSDSLHPTEPSEYIRHLSGGAEEYARNLFRWLREFDILGVDIVLVESICEQGIGAAVMDRLRKAAQ